MARTGASNSSKATKSVRLERLAPLLLSGVSQTEIARSLDVSQSTVSRDVQTLLDGWREQALHKVDERVGLQMSQYDALIHAHWPLALQGKTRNAEIVMQAMAQLSKLIGADRPAKQQINMDTGVRIEIVGVSDEDMP